MACQDWTASWVYPPRQIMAPADVVFTSMATAPWGVIALSNASQVYTCGCSGSTSISSTHAWYWTLTQRDRTTTPPTQFGLVPALANMKTKLIAAGPKQAGVITENDEIYVWGRHSPAVSGWPNITKLDLPPALNNQSFTHFYGGYLFMNVYTSTVT